MGRMLIPNLQEVQENLDKIKLGMNEVDIGNKLKDEHHNNGMRLLKEVKEYLIDIKYNCMGRC